MRISRQIYTKNFQTSSGHKSTGDLLSDYCDGTVYKNHPLLAKDPNFLEIILYYDELEVCNPIGSKRIIHKLGTFISILLDSYYHPIMFSYSCILFHPWKHSSQA